MTKLFSLVFLFLMWLELLKIKELFEYVILAMEGLR